MGPYTTLLDEGGANEQPYMTVCDQCPDIKNLQSRPGHLQLLHVKRKVVKYTSIKCILADKADFYRPNHTYNKCDTSTMLNSVCA